MISRRAVRLIAVMLEGFSFYWEKGFFQLLVTANDSLKATVGGNQLNADFSGLGFLIASRQRLLQTQEKLHSVLWA